GAGVEPHAGALVDAGVVQDGAGVDGDGAVAVGFDAAAGVAGVVVGDDAVEDGQRADADVAEALQGDAAAGGGGGGVGQGHAGEHDAGGALGPDAAAAALVAVARPGEAAGDLEPLEGDGERRRVLGAGVDVEDAVQPAAVHHAHAAAGVADGQVLGRPD